MAGIIIDDDDVESRKGVYVGGTKGPVERMTIRKGLTGLGQSFGSTISKDLTGGKGARNAALLEEFGKKNIKNLSSWSRAKEGASQRPSAENTVTKFTAEEWNAQFSTTTPPPGFQLKKYYFDGDGDGRLLADDLEGVDVSDFYERETLNQKRRIQRRRNRLNSGNIHKKMLGQSSGSSIDSDQDLEEQLGEEITPPADVMVSRQRKKDRGAASASKPEMTKQSSSLRVNENNRAASPSLRAPQPPKLGKFGEARNYPKRDVVRKLGQKPARGDSRA